MSAGSDDYPVDTVAHAWLVKMRGENPEAHRGEFEAWLSASPDHKVAYERITKKLAAAAILKSSSRHGTAQTEQRSGRRRAARRWLSAGAVIAAAAVVFLAFGAGGAPLSGPLGDGVLTARAAEPLVTRRGEIRSFRFADGSTAVLDTDSRLEVSFAHEARHLRLAKGRVRLSVTKNEQPLRVEVSDGVVTAEDAAFDIGFEENGALSVTMLRGEADIRFGGAPESVARHARALPSGQSVTYGPHGKEQPPAASPTQQDSREWPSGWANYRSVRLDQLIAETNRYAAKPIVIDDARTAGLEASGRFRISQPDTVAERLALLFDLEITKRADGTHLRQR
ncbi:FecR domain-containing protein [Sphingopyxis sp. SE2]|uniref:FecR family protein n=1 Tax=Sphingopyxis sp. SE2 TaxID=1586240 RepID=UPI0028BFC277|nr:FecR domain-containing protein [Sphingopyxis sp. SE2]MDT7530016.1 FecR domain-containing protein [Sphingopyxis sp. SE2]